MNNFEEYYTKEDFYNDFKSNKKQDILYRLYELAVENEELKGRIYELEEKYIDLRADYGTKTQIERDLAVDKIEELQERIDKAIEYIEDTTVFDAPRNVTLNDTYIIDSKNYDEFIKILKGEE